MGSRNYHNVFEIIKNDLKSAFSNPIVTIVLIGLIILPSLYALLNIEACWDPYGNTGDVAFAIANLDEGASFEGNEINIGNELISDLKHNDKFKWTFVTEEKLRDGVYKGEFYAGIIIPKNLSKNIISIAGDDPQQAKLEYIVNMKQNPVAAKLTDTGSNTIYTSLNAKIVEFINLAAYGKLGELQEGLASGASQLSSGGSQLAAGSSQISSGADQVSSGTKQVESGSDQVKDGAKEVQSGSTKVSDGEKAVKDGASEVKNGAEQVQSASTKVSDGEKAVEKGASDLQKGTEQLEQGAEELESAVDPSIIPDGPVKDYVEGVNELANGSIQVANGASDLAGGSVELAEGSTKLANGSSQVAGGAVELADGSVELAEGSTKLANGSSQVAGGASELADGSVELAEGSLALAAGSELLSNAATQALFTAASSLSSSADSLSAITGINETLLGDYFYAPIKLDRHELFSVPDYGSQVSPFYLVLSMWVGALITCAMLKPGTSEGTKYSALEMYAGKIVIFLIMSLLQGAVTIIGAHLLGIYIDNEPLFIVSCLLVSAVFMILVYSIVSALGDVGKAIAVVLLVIQISGTGGIYPVEIMAQFFNYMNPYLPMTYAITLIREAQLGLVWSNYIQALVVLLGIGLATVILMLIIKEKADKATHYFEERLEESGLF